MRNALQTALQGVSTPLAAPETVTATAGGVTSTVILNQLESLGCSLDSLRVEVAQLATAGTIVLKQIADELTRRLNYLDEPISVIEVDVAVQVRSTVPAQVPGGLEYFEVLVAATGITLMRWRKPAIAGDPRTPVPADLTLKVLCRVCQDTYEVLRDEFKLQTP